MTQKAPIKSTNLRLIDEDSSESESDEGEDDFAVAIDKPNKHHKGGASKHQRLDSDAFLP